MMSFVKVTLSMNNNSKPISQTTIKVRPIMERITSTDLLSLVLNGDEFLRTKRRVVDLACGHKTITAAAGQASCPRCQEMLQRSVDGGQEDYDAFRNHGARDRMIWRADPLRQFHEPTDLAGNFLNE